SERLRVLELASTRAGAGAEPPARASSPPAGDAGSGASGTQTFAARGALLEWTAKIDSTPPRPSASALPYHPEIESGLTAPTPSRPPRSVTSRGQRRAVVAALALGGLSLAGLGGRAWLQARAASNQPVHAAAAVTASHVPAAPQTAPLANDTPPRAESAPLPVQVPPTASPSRAPAPPAHAPAPDSAARTSKPRAPTPSDSAVPRASNAAPAALARLQLTADPVAWVEVDAVRVGRTPLDNHGVSPGRHTITFVNQMLGERLDATVRVDAQHPARVHADFSSANPRVYVR
ncbi:MAG TPA: hypothetical protein VMG12_32580, partial [Polyangiaceae bacterium]|nr:hypothetical protein [Polyangiaceae bacterium]